MKWAIIGDIHLRNNNLSTRLTDYNTALFNKLEYIYNYCKANNINKIIFLGDIQTAIDTDILDEIKNRFILQRQKYSNIEFYTIIGNHDIHSNDLTYLYKSSILTMAFAGAFKLLINELYLDNIRCIILNPDLNESKKILKNLKDTEQPTIVFGHHLFEYNLTSSCLKTEDFNIFKNWKYPVNVFLGDDHTQYTPKKFSNIILHRLGSLMRTEKPQTDTNWHPMFAILDIQNLNIDYKYIPCESYEVAFGTPVNINKYKNLANLNKIKESLIQIGTTDYSQLNISTILKNLLQCPEKYMDCLKDIHLSLGETF